MDMHEWDEWEREVYAVAKGFAAGWAVLLLAAVGAWFWWGPE